MPCKNRAFFFSGWQKSPCCLLSSLILTVPFSRLSRVSRERARRRCGARSRFAKELHYFTIQLFWHSIVLVFGSLEAISQQPEASSFSLTTLIIFNDHRHNEKQNSEISLYQKAQTIFHIQGNIGGCSFQTVTI
jgi:hypothetical protein